MTRETRHVLDGRLRDGFSRSSLVVLMLVGPLVVPATAEKVPLVATVSWSDAAGTTGQAAFQGVTEGDTLRGRLTGGGERLYLEGTVDADGAVSGVLKTPAGAEVGTFAATVVDEELQGSYAVIGGEYGAWEAPPVADSAPAE